MKTGTSNILINPGYQHPCLKWLYHDKDNFYGEKRITGISFETKKKIRYLFFQYLDWEDWMFG